MTTRVISSIKVMKPFMKGHIVNRILHSWSFHMKFMKLAEGLMASHIRPYIKILFP